MSGESTCRTCPRDLVLMCPRCDVDSEHVDRYVELERAEDEIERLRALIHRARPLAQYALDVPQMEEAARQWYRDIPDTSPCSTEAPTK